jgi:hypothetical protein
VIAQSARDAAVLLSSAKLAPLQER